MKFFITLIVSIGLFSCAAPVKKDPMVDGTNFIDENLPKLSVDFPFEIELEESSWRAITTDEGATISISSYSLKGKNEGIYVYISKQKIADIGHMASFRGTDESLIDDKIYLTKNKYGFCSIFFDIRNDYQTMESRVAQYRYGKEITEVGMIKALGKNYNLNRLLDADKNLLDEFKGYTEQICSQLVSDKPLDIYPSGWRKLIETQNRHIVFHDKHTGSDWYLMTHLGKVDTAAAKNICNLLNTEDSNSIRVPSLVEYNELWEGHKNSEALKVFGGNDYISNELAYQGGGTTGRIFSISNGRSEVTYTGYLACIKP